MFGWLFKRRDELFGAPRSGRWPAVRKKHLESQPCCQACGRSREIEVHHIEPFHDKPDLELSPENLISLCANPCHFVHGHLMDWKRSNSFVVEDCRRYRQRLSDSRN